MSIIIHSGPVNPAQVRDVLVADSCTVRDNGDGTVEVDVPGVGEDNLRTTVVGLVYDESAGYAPSRLDELEAEVRGIKERVRDVPVTNADAKAVRDAVAGGP